MDKQAEKQSEVLELHQRLEEATDELERHIIEAKQLMAENRQILADLNANPVRRALSFIAGFFRKS